MTGLVNNIQKYSVHDGGGIRTVVFFQGCPLRCRWCSNPETQPLANPRLYWRNKCIGCGRCVEVCPRHIGCRDLHSPDCRRCLACVENCCTGALTLAAQEMTVKELVQKLLRDEVYYHNSGGGVTLSGGEVLMQWQFAAQVLALCKNAGVHTAVESCLLAPPQAIEALLPVTDQFLVDIKFRDPALHKKHLGADNRAILENFEHLLAQDADVLVRTPLIPGYTATDENLRAIARYLRRVATHTPWELLNFNPLCRGKYAALERDYPVSGGSLTQAELQRFYDILEQEGITNIVKE